MRTFAEQSETAFNRSDKRQNSKHDEAVWSSVSAPILNLQIQRKAECACGGDCPACQAKHSHLPVSHPTDASELEADATADKIMRMPETSPRKGSCEHCEEKLQRKVKDGGNSMSNVSPAIGETINSSSGRSMDEGTRSFMESRFGYDFSGVKIHDNESAAKSAGSINARAYTLDSNIVFNSGQYNPNSESGKRLLAHELTHVVQQGAGATNSVQRTVAATSTCAANVHDAPADPLAALTDADQLARDKALSASFLLLLESFDFDDPALGRTSIFDAYSHWFGTPTQSSGRWRSRFRTATFATENEAIRHELETFSDRFQRIKNWLDGNITYRCPGTGAFTIPGCASRTCGTDEAAITCPTGTRRIIICPGFWAPTDQARYARYIIHEALHPLFHFSGHPTATPAGRARNPGCYQGFVREVFDGGGTVADCTALP